MSNLDYRVKFFTEQDLTQISQVVRQKLGPECVKACRSGVQEPEIVSLSKLVSSYGKVTVKDVVAVRKSDASTQIIGILSLPLSGLLHIFDMLSQHFSLNSLLELVIPSRTTKSSYKFPISGSSTLNMSLMQFRAAKASD